MKRMNVHTDRMCHCGNRTSSSAEEALGEGLAMELLSVGTVAVVAVL